jgi:hypothetical protein
MGTSTSDFEVGSRYTLTLADQTSLDGIIDSVAKNTISINNIETDQLKTVSRKDITNATEFTLAARHWSGGTGPNWLGDAGYNTPVGSGTGGGTSAQTANGGVAGRQYHVFGCGCGKCGDGGVWVD